MIFETSTSFFLISFFLFFSCFKSGHIFWFTESFDGIFCWCLLRNLLLFFLQRLNHVLVCKCHANVFFLHLFLNLQNPDCTGNTCISSCLALNTNMLYVIVQTALTALKHHLKCCRLHWKSELCFNYLCLHLFIASILHCIFS